MKIPPVIPAMTTPVRKLCILTTHPIQYMAPWFRLLAQESGVELHVLFLRELKPEQQGVGFGKSFQWDVPLREGYKSSVLSVSDGWRDLPRLVWQLRQSLRALAPDVVLVTGWNEIGLALAYPLCRLLGFPVVLRGESNALRKRALAKRLFHRMLLSFVSAAVVIGKANRQFYLDSQFPAQKLFAGAYFVESTRMLAMVSEHASQRDGLRSDLGLGQQDFVFCFVGKHVSFKRPHLLIEAAALLRQKGLQVKLLFAGSGELTEQLQDLAGSLGVPAHFAGFLNQTEMWKAYIPADAFVLPSTNGETWGLVTNEAMLFGLPVIVSDQVGCWPDLVIDGETGYRFAGGAEGLAAAMERLLLDPAKARHMGAAGRKLVEESYSMSIATKGLLQAISAVSP